MPIFSTMAGKAFIRPGEKEVDYIWGDKYFLASSVEGGNGVYGEVWAIVQGAQGMDKGICF